MSEVPTTEPPAPSGLVRRAGVAFAWAQLSKLLEVALTTAIGVIAVRALGPDGFGSFAFLTNLFLVLSAFVPFATADALAVLLPRFQERPHRVVVLVWLGLLRLGVIVVVFAILAALWLPLRDELGMGAVTLELFLLAGLFWLVSDALTTVAGFFLADLDSRPVALWRSLGLSVALAAMVAAALLGRTTVGIVFAALAAGHGLGLVGLLVQLRRGGTGMERVPRDRVREIGSVTASMWAAALLTSAISTQVDTILLGAITADVREVAFFAAALAVLGRAQLLLYAGWVASVLPALGEAHAQRGAEGLVRAWDLAVKLWIFVALPLNALALVLGPPAVELVFGEIYAPAGGLLAWMAAFGFLFAFTGGMVWATALWVLGLQRWVVRVRLVTALLHVGAAVVLISRYAALGAVIASWLGLFATALGDAYYARRVAPLRLPVGFVLRGAVAAAAGALAAFAVRPDDAATLAAGTVLGVGAFVLALALTRPFTDRDVDALRRFSPRVVPLVRRFSR